MYYGYFFGANLGTLSDPDMLLDDQQLHHLVSLVGLQPVLGSHPVVLLVRLVPGAFNIPRLQREYIRVRKRLDC